MWQTHGMEKQIPKRYLLCRPEGGLNDILSEIGKCISYGKKFGRCVIVETNSKHHFHFKDVFGKYFNSLNQDLILDSIPHVHNFNGMSVQPACLAGHVTHYSSDEIATLARGEFLSFDFSRDFSEELLVHHSNGQIKRRNALIALSQLSLKQSLVDELEACLAVLGNDYHAFHIRHTDHKTDYEGRVLALAPSIKGRIFLGTDNKSVVKFFHEVFGKDRVITFSKMPDKAGIAAHYGNVGEDIWIRNRDAIVDLLIIAMANHYHFFSRESGKRRVFAAYSGYSILAARLRSAPQIMRSLLPVELHNRIKKLDLLSSLRNLRWRYF